MRPGGRPAVHYIYALTRFVSREADPFDAYRLKRRSTRSAYAKFQESAPNRRERFLEVQRVQTSLLLENEEVRAALARLFDTTDSDDVPQARPAYGFGSIFPTAYLCASGLVEPASKTGTVELESTIYYSGAIDLKLHCVFRVE